MRRNTKLVGDISEAKVLTALVEAGFHVLIPFGENHRYDFVVDSNGTRIVATHPPGGIPAKSTCRLRSSGR